MSEISKISSSQIKVYSKPKVTLEGVKEKPPLQVSDKMKELQKFEMEMKSALAMANTIRDSLESALKELN